MTPSPSLPGARRARRRLARERAFTLVELMIVVVVIGILATLAVYGVRRYVLSAKTAEATQMIGAIKAGQEAYFDETFRYLDVNGGLDTNRYPVDADWGSKVQWGGGSGAVAQVRNNFATLGVSSSGAVQFRYSSVAGAPGASAPSFGVGVTASEYNFPSSPAVHWYIVKAIADLDEDGVYSVFLGSNFSNEIFSKNPGD